MKPSECFGVDYKVESIRSLLRALDRLVWPNQRQHCIAYQTNNGDKVRIFILDEKYPNILRTYYCTEKRKYVVYEA